MQGYLRSDGRKGIRNHVLVVYLVECARHVAGRIAEPYRDHGVHLIGFPGCFPNTYAHRMLEKLCTHPNVAGVLLVSLGCEGMDRAKLVKTIHESQRPADVLVIQQTGGTRKTIHAGRAWLDRTLDEVSHAPTCELDWSDLVVGTICGGSDATSGLTANPAIGLAFDTLIDRGATCIFEETGELIGCEPLLAQRAATPQLAEQLTQSVAKAAAYYHTLGHASFAPGNATGGITTIEEKSLGAYTKSGSRPIVGLIKPGDRPTVPGLYLMDVVPDGPVRFGFPNIADNAEIVEMIASGCQVILFSTGRGSVVGSAIAPVIKVCANPQTYARLHEDMDLNAGAVLTGDATLAQVGERITELTRAVACGQATASEDLGHQEFILTYKSFEPLGPACLPTM